MKLVPDASAAVKWVVAEEDTPAARRMLTDANELHAPRLLAAEVANALRSKVRQGLIAPSDAVALISTVTGQPIHWADDENVAADALGIALALGRPIYDCMYLALARRIGAGGCPVRQCAGQDGIPQRCNTAGRFCRGVAAIDAFRGTGRLLCINSAVIKGASIAGGDKEDAVGSQLCDFQRHRPVLVLAPEAGTKLSYARASAINVHRLTPVKSEFGNADGLSESCFHSLRVHPRKSGPQASVVVLSSESDVKNINRAIVGDAAPVGIRARQVETVHDFHCMRVKHINICARRTLFQVAPQVQHPGLTAHIQSILYFRSRL